MCVHIITHSIQLNSFSAVTDFSAHVLGEISTSFESSLPKNPEQHFAPLVEAGRALKIDFLLMVWTPLNSHAFVRAFSYKAPCMRTAPFGTGISSHVLANAQEIRT